MVPDKDRSMSQLPNKTYVYSDMTFFHISNICCVDDQSTELGQLHQWVLSHTLTKTN
jgi:hypothetical protein